MTLLYKLEKATIEMAGVMSQVVSLSKEFEQQWSQNLDRVIAIRSIGLQRRKNEQG